MGGFDKKAANPLAAFFIYTTLTDLPISPIPVYLMYINLAKEQMKCIF
jgi:hypothetical protein